MSHVHREPMNLKKTEKTNRRLGNENRQREEEI